MSFLTDLDRKSYEIVTKKLQEYLLGPQNVVKDLLSKQIIPPKGGSYKYLTKIKAVNHLFTRFMFRNVEEYWIEMGSENSLSDESYILTPTVRRNLCDIARIVSMS